MFEGKENVVFTTVSLYLSRSYFRNLESRNTWKEVDPLTDGERRNKLRRELKVGKFTKEAVDRFLSQRRRGTSRKEPTFGFDGGTTTLTEILDRNPGIRRAYEESGVRTSHGQRNKLREDLLKGRDPRQKWKDSRKSRGGNRRSHNLLLFPRSFQEREDGCWGTGSSTTTRCLPTETPRRWTS